MMATKQRGRPSKPGDREPNGRPQRPHAPQPPMVAIQRDLETIQRERLNPLLGSLFGRLLLEHKITKPEFAAGERFLALRASVDRIQGLPARHPAGLDMDRVGGRSLGPQELSKSDWSAMKRLEAAEGILGDYGKAGGRWWVINQLVVHGIPLATYEQFLKLRTGLGALVEHWGLRG